MQIEKLARTHIFDLPNDALRLIIRRNTETMKAARPVIQQFKNLSEKQMIGWLNSKKPLSSLGLTPAALENLLKKEGEHLKHFEVANMNGQTVFKLFQYCPNVSHLVLKNCNISADGAKIISTFSNLTILDLNENNIGAEGAKEISRLANLTTLNLRGNDIGAEGAKEISRLAI